MWLVSLGIFSEIVVQPGYRLSRPKIRKHTHPGLGSKPKRECLRPSFVESGLKHIYFARWWFFLTSLYPFSCLLCP